MPDQTMKTRINGRTLYDVAAAILTDHGVRRVEDAYAFFPDMHPRTVRRVWEKVTVLMCEMGSEQEKPIQPIKDSISPDDLAPLLEAAAEAKVNPRSAVTAVTRFGNAIERVTAVLRDIRTLAANGMTPRNPSGLFVSCMRKGTDVKLPVGLGEPAAEQKPKHPPLRVGEWVRWNLEWMRVLSVTAVSALLSPTDDELDSYKCPVENLLHLPRREAFPAGNA